MTPLIYRELMENEARLLERIDRSEQVNAVYELRDGKLVPRRVQHDIVSWTTMYDAGVKYTRPNAVTENTKLIKDLTASGGSSFGAWRQDEFVGLAALDISPVGGNPRVMKLELLYVSAPHRGNGIGRALVDLVANEAHSRGCTTLYISSTPTQATVDAYLRMGAELLDAPDAELLAQQPNDIHLALRLTQAADGEDAAAVPSTAERGLAPDGPLRGPQVK